VQAREKGVEISDLASNLLRQQLGMASWPRVAYIDLTKRCVDHLRITWFVVLIVIKGGDYEGVGYLAGGD
jgi:hypothetical protein